MNDFELNTKLKIKSMWICIALYAAGSLLSFFSIALGDVFVFLVGFFVWLFYLFLSEAITVICIVSGVRQTVAAKRHAPISDKPCNVLIPIFSILNMALFVAAFFIFPPTNDSRNGVSSLVVTFIAIQIVYCVFDIIFMLRYRKYRRLCKVSAPAAAPTLTSTLAPTPASASAPTLTSTSAPTSVPTSIPTSVPAQSQFASTQVQSQPVPSQFAQVPAQSQSQSQFASTPVPPQPYIQAAPQQMSQYQQPISQPMSQQMPQQINYQQQAGASQQIPQYQQPNAIPQAQPVQPQIVPQPVQQPISQPISQPMQQQFPQAPVSPMGAPSSTAGNAPSSFTNGAAGSVDVDFNEDNYSQL